MTRGAHHCCDEVLAKGSPLGSGSGDGEGEDPRYQTLWRLVQAARRDWRRWRSLLMREVTRTARAGMLPMTPERQVALQALLAEHGTRIVYRMTGLGPVPAGVEASRSYLETAYRVGVAHQVLDPLAEAPPARIVAVAGDVKLGDLHRSALEYVRLRGAVYMRRPVTRLSDDMERVVLETDRELDALERRMVRQEVAGALVRHETAQVLAQRLRAQAYGTGLDNDMDRVARTELLFAHNHGAKEELKQQSLRSGEEDPWVFKQISPHACAHCIRLWGLPGNARKYRLSEIEANDAGGGNVGVPADLWVATTGPIHPNCTCGPLLRYTPGMDEAIQRAADRILRHHGV